MAGGELANEFVAPVLLNKLIEKPPMERI